METWDTGPTPMLLSHSPCEAAPRAKAPYRGAKIAHAAVRRGRPPWSAKPLISIQSGRPLTATGVPADNAVGTGGISVYVMLTGVAPRP